MPMFRIEKNREYVVMSKHHLKNKKLSLKAKGLMSFVLSLPDDWEFSIKGLSLVLKEGEEAIASALKELEEQEYLERIKQRNEEGKFGQVEYIFYEIPKTDFLGQGNTAQINNNIINNNIYNIDTSENDVLGNGSEGEESESEMESNFELIWKEYPRKDGKARAFEGYKQWLRGKKIGKKRIQLDNYEMWEATKKYAELVEKEKREEKYIKMGSTFFTSTILDYIEEN